MVRVTQDTCIICKDQVEVKEAKSWFAFECKDPTCGESAEHPERPVQPAEHMIPGTCSDVVTMDASMVHTGVMTATKLWHRLTIICCTSTA